MIVDNEINDNKILTKRRLTIKIISASKYSFCVIVVGYEVGYEVGFCC